MDLKLYKGRNASRSLLTMESETVAAADKPYVAAAVKLHEFFYPLSFKLSLLSVLSAFSILSVGSTLSIASSFSVLSIGSHQSILSIGCNNRMLMICGYETYTDVDLPTDGGDIAIDKVDSETNLCGANEAAVHYSSPQSLPFSNYELCSVDEETPYTCAAATSLSDNQHVCVSEEQTKKDMTLFVRRNADAKVQAVAHMPTNYDYNRATNRDDYVEIKEATIVIPDAGDWADFSACTREQKKEDICDYKDARCTFDGTTYDCEVKRKGNGSWRDVDKKPSVKVKWYNSGKQYRLTFNNNVQEKTPLAQIQAFQTFRAAGIDASRASSVNLRFGHSMGALNAYLPYTQVEEVKNFEFLGARGLDGSMVFELEGVNIKQVDIDRGPDMINLGPVAEDDATLMDFQMVLQPGTSLQRTWEVIDKTNLFRYYAAIHATGHMDSWCAFSPEANNGFVFLPYFQKRYIFFPWGVDRTMKCNDNWLDWFVPTTLATCAPMKSCFASAQCSKEYFDFVKAENIPPKLCGPKRVYALFTTVLTALVLLPRVMCLYWPKRFPSAGKNGVYEKLTSETTF